MKIIAKVAVTTALALTGLGITGAGASASATAYSIDVKPDQPQRLEGRSVQMSARITSHREQTINSYVEVQTHDHVWLGASPDSTDYAAGQSKTIRYRAHHAGIRRALRHGHSVPAKFVAWIAEGRRGIETSHKKVVRFQISPR